VDIELPQTSAALESEDEEDLGQLLEDELEEHAAALVNNYWLQSGGWPDQGQVSVVKVIVNDQGPVATLRVQFVELVASACHDSPHRLRGEGTVQLRLARSSRTGVVRHGASGSDCFASIELLSALLKPITAVLALG
jgi:hypothetical protein